MTLRGSGWTLHTPSGEVMVSLPTAAVMHAREQPDPATRAALEEWLLAARKPGRARSDLVDIARALGKWSRFAWPRTHDAEALVRAAFASQQLRAERRPQRVPIAPQAALEPEASAFDRGDRVEQKTWVAIRLVYDDDPAKPVPNARYVLTLPDGSVHRGRTDRDGCARVDGIDPGVCDVVFPDFDRRKGAPAAKVPAGKGHTPRKLNPGVVATEPSTSSPSPADTRCHATDLELVSQSGERSKRQPDASRVLQVVPVATNRDVFEMGLPFNPAAAEKITKSATNLGHVVGALRDGGLAGGLFALAMSDAVEDAKKKRAAHQGKKSSGGPRKWAVTLKVISDVYTQGVAKVRLRPVTSVDCGTRHPVAHLGPSLKHETVAPNAADLRWLEGGEAGPSAGPTVYRAIAKGCAGDEVPLRVEVFPSDQRLAAISFEGRAEPTGEWLPWVRETLATWLGAALDCSFILEGRIERFRGWREEDKSWRVYFAEEYRVRFVPRVEAKLTISLLQLLAKVPSSFTKYAGDVGVIVAIDLGLLVSAEGTSREYPSDAALSRRTAKGVVQGAGKGAFGLYAQAGSKDVLGVVITGTVNAEVKAGGTLAYDRGKLSAQPEAELGEVRGQVKVLTRALVWKYEESWEIVLRDKQKFAPEKPYTVLDLNG